MPENLSSYLAEIFAVSLAGTLCEFILKNSSANSKTLENGLKLVISLCLIVSIFVPASRFVLRELPDLYEEQSFSDMFLSTNAKNDGEGLLQLTVKETQNNLCEKIYEKFGILPDSVNIDFIIENNGQNSELIITGADISVKKECSYAFQDIKEYAEALLGATVKINGE